MKNKWMFAMFVAAGVLLATSCSSGEEFIVPAEEAKVRFSLGLESGMNTRAVGDGTVAQDQCAAAIDIAAVAVGAVDL